MKSGELWALDIAAEDTKNQRALDFPISAELSARIDIYLEKFRKRIPGAIAHDGLWPRIRVEQWMTGLSTTWSVVAA